MAKINQLAAKIVYLSPEKAANNNKSFFRTAGLRDHKGDRSSINLFGDIANQVTKDEAS